MATNVNKTRIAFDYGGTHYVLEYTAASLKAMEENGFRFNAMDEMIITAPEKLFCGAFNANHRAVPNKKRLEIYNELCASSADGQSSLNDVIASMLSEALEEITNRGGNTPWEVLR